MTESISRRRRTRATIPGETPGGASTVWMPLGIWNRTAAEAAGLTVVMDRCIKIEYARLLGEAPAAG